MRLSPSALARWPTVARQMSDAGVLDSASGEALVRYCEAFAQWCEAGDQLAMMLIDLGLTANRLRIAPAEDRQNSPQPATEAESKPETVRPPNAIIRRAEVESETGLSRSTIYQRIKAGTFPPPVRLGVRSVGWRVADIEAFLASPADYEAVDGGISAKEGVSGD